MDCCQYRLKLAKVSLDGEVLGQIEQIDGIQKYTISVERRGKFKILSTFINERLTKFKNARNLTPEHIL